MSFSGTSAATAHVTGAVALYKSEHSGESPSDINALKSLGSKQDTQCDGNGHGYFKEDPDHNADLYCTSQVLLLVRKYVKKIILISLSNYIKNSIKIVFI